MWYIIMYIYFISIFFIQSTADSNVYRLSRGSDFVVLVLYVDDVIFVINSKFLLAEVKFMLSIKFEMKDIGEFKYCFGVQIFRVRDEGLIIVYQQKYSDDIFRKFKLDEVRSVIIFFVTGIKFISLQCFQSDAEVRDMKDVFYRYAVGSFIFVVNWIRSDIQYYVSTVF